MNKIIFASVIAASVLGFANASYAVGGKARPWKEIRK